MTIRTTTVPHTARLLASALLSGLALTSCSSAEAGGGIAFGTPAPENTGPTAASTAPTFPSPTAASSSAPVANTPAAASSSATPTAPDASAPTPSSEVQQDEQVLAQYKAYWTLQQTLQEMAPSERAARLSRVALNPVLAQTLKAARERDAAGEVLYGTIIVKPKVELLQDDKALVRDCQNTSNSGRMNTATKEKLTVGVPEYVRFVTLRRGAEGAWRVSDIASTTTGAC